MIRGVAITFDDGPDATWTPRVLAELRRLSAPATFFVLGERAEAQPALANAIRRAGHEVGLHGYRHLRHDAHSGAEIEADARRALEILGATSLWRAPHGITTPASVAVARRLELQLVTWTVDSVDWLPSQTSEQMLDRVTGALEPGASVLLHDAVGPGSARESPAPTLELLAPLIGAIRRRGLEPTLLSDIRQAPPPDPGGWLFPGSAASGLRRGGWKRLAGRAVAPPLRAS